jgi:hypothetical protein
MTTYLIAGCIGSGAIYPSTDTSSNYTNYTTGTGSSTWSSRAASKNWSSIATSADGTKLAACINTNNQNIYTSTDGGSIWTERIGSGALLRSWRAIASSSNGDILVAASRNSRGSAGSLFLSMDSGVSWQAQLDAGSKLWTGVTISSDGTKIAACAQNQYIVTGVYSANIWTWESRNQSEMDTLYWRSITSSSNGNIIYACENGAEAGRIWKSIDSGVTWNATSAASALWNSVTTNSTGTKIAAAISNILVSPQTPGQIWVSTNEGTSFQGPYGGSYVWTSISYSSDGAVLAACVNTSSPSNDYVYVSGNDGVSFTKQTTAGTANWSAITVSGPISGVCFRDSTRVVMADGTFKAIKDLQRGDEILTDKKNGETKKVARILQYMATGKAIQIPMHLIGNSRSIVCSRKHPFWIGDNRRILAGDIEGAETIKISEWLYNIQFEDEGSYYVEGVKVDAVSPDNCKHKLPKELYFDETKYEENRVVNTEDDECRKKPKMTKTL